MDEVTLRDKHWKQSKKQSKGDKLVGGYHAHIECELQ